MKRLPLFAFILAAFGAFAFSFPKEEGNMERWALIDGVFQDVTSIVTSGEYDCDATTEQIHCLYDGNNGNPVSPIETKFVPH
ncbi:hypothetical protein [Algoriphagus pacificus]|uniref:Uncharacterized protein n=1 Tax=Algoriphagus pacificus TaxID=2811234 RepID=A0ABS3CDE5_9BACT|nr:hypothetical protein [Algoriphagus pacificus]MBN7814201.1 hypothetical protein [Algoriphagus pacificus]